jgi:hypothetical protein
VPVGRRAEYDDEGFELDRNGEPCEDHIACLVMLVCVCGITLITWAALIGVLVSNR